MFTVDSFLPSVLTGMALLLSPSLHKRRWPRDHLETPVLTFHLFPEERDTEDGFPSAITCCFSCSLLTLISHCVTHHIFQTRVLSCGASSWVTGVCCFWSVQYYCLAWLLVSDSEVVAGKVSCAQHFPMGAWLPHRERAAEPGEACLPVYQEENTKWFSLFWFHPAVLQVTSPVKWGCFGFIWNMFFTYSSDFLVYFNYL